MNQLNSQRQQAQARLQAWARFPVEQEPRPLVLLDSPVTAVPLAGTQADGGGLTGDMEGACGLPPEVLRALRAHCKGYGALSVQVTAATLSMAEFFTDRGSQRLPAWEVYARVVPSPVWVLDPGISSRVWRPSGLQEHEFAWRGTVARLQADGRTFDFRFSGMPHAFADYPSAELYEIGGAVAVVPVPKDRGWPGTRPLLAQMRNIKVSLAEALGNRILLDANGSPVAVESMNQRSRIENVDL